MRGQIKRPEYIVGVPGIGAVAFDVRAKGIFNGSTDRYGFCFSKLTVVFAP